MINYNQTTKTPADELLFLTYVSEHNGSPKPDFISSRPSTGGEFANMYGLPSDRKHLIETEEGYLMGICDKTNKLCRFYIIDDTYVVQIPSILKLKKQLGDLPLPPIDPNFKIKSRWYKK